jgi:hypothetical protein
MDSSPMGGDKPKTAKLQYHYPPQEEKKVE